MVRYNYLTIGKMQSPEDALVRWCKSIILTNYLGGRGRGLQGQGQPEQLGELKEIIKIRKKNLEEVYHRDRALVGYV